MTGETKYKDNWCQEAYERGKAEATKELQKENKKLKNRIAELESIKDVETLIKANNSTVVTLMIQLNNKLVSANQQIEKMKSDVRGNLIFAEHKNNEIMRQKMCSMLLQWETRYK